MKKRALSLLMSLVMLVSMLPTTAWAADTTETTTPTKVKVDFTAQAEGAFLIAPQFNVEVASNEAERFGYTDSVTNGVSALDVLVKAHEIAFDPAFTADTAAEYLSVSNQYGGFVTKLFGIETGANGFILNGGYPNNEGTGTTVLTQAISNEDRVEFFCYQDQKTYKDELAWFCKAGTGAVVESISTQPSAELQLKMKSFAYGDAYAYRDAETMHLAGRATIGAQLAWVSETGATEDITGAMTGEDGSVTIKAPDAE